MIISILINDIPVRTEDIMVAFTMGIALAGIYITPKKSKMLEKRKQSSKVEITMKKYGETI